MPVMRQLNDGRLVEVMTPEELAQHRAAVERGQKAKAAFAARKHEVLAGIPNGNANALMRAIADAIGGSPMLLCKVMDVLDAFGLPRTERRPDSNSQLP